MFIDLYMALVLIILAFAVGVYIGYSRPHINGEREYERSLLQDKKLEMIDKIIAQLNQEPNDEN